MVRVYLDPTAVFVRIGQGEDPVLAPDASAALNDLADTGHEAVLINPNLADLPPELEDLLGADDVDPNVSGWIITGDRHRCEQRYPQLRTVQANPRTREPRRMMRRGSNECRSTRVGRVPLHDECYLMSWTPTASELPTGPSPTGPVVM